MTSSDLFGTLFLPGSVRAAVADRAWIAAMLEFEAALAAAEARAGVIPAEAAAAIAAACDAEGFDPQALGREARDAGNPAVPLVRALTEAVEGDAARYVHWGATSQDVMDTAAMLVARRALAVVGEELRAGGRGMRGAGGRAPRHGDARPHAAPAGAPHHVRPEGRRLAVRGSTTRAGGSTRCRSPWSWAGPRARSPPSRPRASACWDTWPRSSGSTSRWCRGTRRGRAWRSSAPRWRSRPARSRRSPRTSTLLAQTEVGEVAEPAGHGRGGSSTLPHKRNPVGSVLAVACARRVRGEASILLGAMAQEHERAAGAWQAEWEALSGALAYTGGAAAALREALEGLEVRPARMRENLDLTGGLVLAESVSMALGERVGRSEAHRLVEAASRRAVEAGRPFREELLGDDAIRAELSAEEIERALDPDGYAGEAGALVERALARYREQP